MDLTIALRGPEPKKQGLETYPPIVSIVVIYTAA